MTVIVRDTRLHSTLARTRKVQQVDIGVFGTAPARDEGGDLTNAIIMGLHEIGAGVPQRSWLRGWIDENEAEIKTVVRRLQRQIWRGRISPETAAKRFGAWAEGQIKQRIANQIPPPNAPSTIARKGSSTPLIDTGQGRTAITHRTQVE